MDKKNTVEPLLSRQLGIRGCLWLGNCSIFEKHYSYVCRQSRGQS